MFRHLSPKTGPKEKQDFNHNKPKVVPLNNHVPPTQKHPTIEQDTKPGQNKEKDIKNLNNFLHHNQMPSGNVVKVINYPQGHNPPNFTNSSDNLKPHIKKNGSAFDDYY